jgi:late competence protein required for DNA uptake (superfamily II DNA/RNA helicase)
MKTILTREIDGEPYVRANELHALLHENHLLRERLEIHLNATCHVKMEKAVHHGNGFTAPLHIPSSEDIYRAGYDLIFNRR